MDDSTTPLSIATAYARRWPVRFWVLHLLVFYGAWTLLTDLATATGWTGSTYPESRAAGAVFLASVGLLRARLRSRASAVARVCGRARPPRDPPSNVALQPTGATWSRWVARVDNSSAWQHHCARGHSARS